MRKAEMVQRIAQELGSTTAKAAAAVEAILTTIKASLQQGEPVILRRFGTWQVRVQRARVGRNPKTGAAAAIPARRVVRFLAGHPFKQAVAGGAPPRRMSPPGGDHRTRCSGWGTALRWGASCTPPRGERSCIRPGRWTCTHTRLDAQSAHPHLGRLSLSGDTLYH